MAPSRRSDADPAPESFVADSAEDTPVTPQAPAAESSGAESSGSAAPSVAPAEPTEDPAPERQVEPVEGAHSPEMLRAAAAALGSPEAAAEEVLGGLPPEAQRRVEELTRRLSRISAQAEQMTSAPHSRPEPEADGSAAGSDPVWTSAQAISDRSSAEQLAQAQTEQERRAADELGRLRPMDDELLEYFVDGFELRHRWSNGTLVVEFELEGSQLTAQMLLAVVTHEHFVELQILGLYQVELSPAEVLPLLNERNFKYRMSRSYHDEESQLRVEMISIHAPQAQMTLRLLSDLFEAVAFELDELLCEFSRDRGFPLARGALQA